MTMNIATTCGQDSHVWLKAGAGSGEVTWELHERCSCGRKTYGEFQLQYTQAQLRDAVALLAEARSALAAFTPSMIGRCCAICGVFLGVPETYEPATGKHWPAEPAEPHQPECPHGKTAALLARLNAHLGTATEAQNAGA